MKEYIGSQEHWEDSVNADHDKREEIQKDQEDNRVKDFYDEMRKDGGYKIESFLLKALIDLCAAIPNDGTYNYLASYEQAQRAIKEAEINNVNPL